MSLLNSDDIITAQDDNLRNEDTPLLLEDDVEQFRPHHNKPSHKWLWMLPFSALLSTIMSSILAPLVQFILQVVCLEFYSRRNDPLQFPLEHINKEIFDEKCRIPEIQAISSQYLMWYTLLSATAATLSIGYLATLSDFRGRRFVFITSEIGIVICLANVLLVGRYWEVLGVKFLFVGSLIQGLLGSVIAINTACHAYVTDCTAPENRSVSFGIMHSTAFLGMTIGPAVGGFIIKATGSILSVFYIALASHVGFLVFVSIILPESVQHTMKRDVRTAYISSPLNFLAPLAIIGQKPREEFEGQRSLHWTGRNALYIIATIYFLYRVSTHGIEDIIVLYTNYKFHWTTFENGFFFSLQAFTRFIALLVLLPLCRIVQLRLHTSSSSPRSLDIWMLRLGLTMEIIGFSLFAIAPVPGLFYLACAINSLATIATPALRSLATTLVRNDQAGQVLGALSVIESIGSVLAPVWMNPLYSILVTHGIPQGVFWANVVVFCIAGVLSSLVW